MTYLFTAGICLLAMVIIAWELDDPEQRWSLLALGIGMLIWAGGYGLVVVCPTDHCALQASRGIFGGVMVGLPGLVVLFRSLITARPTPRRSASSTATRCG